MTTERSRMAREQRSPHPNAADRSPGRVTARTWAGNRLLAVLSAGDRTLLSEVVEEVSLETWQVLEAPGRRIAHVYFPVSGLVSVVGTNLGSERIEVGMAGYEGMTGLAVVLGHDRSSNETVVQAAGDALRIPSSHMKQVLKSSPTLRGTLLRYVHAFMMQASQTALANGRARLNQRLARWLLMWHDRLRTPHLTVTHEFLALLLGVRRQGVTVALHELEGQGLIKGTRNLVTILDRPGLRSLAGSFYGVPEAEYEALLRRRQRS